VPSRDRIVGEVSLVRRVAFIVLIVVFVISTIYGLRTYHFDENVLNGALI